MDNFTDREAWLTEGADQIVTDLMGTEMPAYRVSVGYAPRHRGGKVLGVCINAEASADNTFEIFLNPSLDEWSLVLEVLTHLMVHVADKMESGHRGRFARIARRIGLEGKLTKTHAGERLGSTLKDICELLGKYPHAAIDIDFTKKQTTRMHKVSCTSCSFHFRASQKMLDMIDFDTAQCPSCQSDGSLFNV